MHQLHELTKGQLDLLAWLCDVRAVSRDTARLMKDRHRIPASALVRKGYVRMDLCRVHFRNMLWLTTAGLRVCTESVGKFDGSPDTSPAGEQTPPSQHQM